MSSMELNKIVAAVLLAGVIAMTTGFLAELLVAPEELIENAYLVETGAGEAAPAEEEEEQVPLAVLLASADPAEGESFVRACASCHTFEQGGADRIGPHLWGVVGRDKGGVDGFGYSSAMEAAEGDWSYEALDGFLHRPRDYLSGTSMSYAGIRDPEDRANVIAYLRTLSEDPLPLPEPPVEEAAAEEEAATAAPPAEPAESAEAGDEGPAGEAAAAEQAADEAEADAAAAATEGGMAAEEAAADAEADAAVAEREAENLAETGGPVLEEAEDAAIDAEQAAGQAERAAEDAGGEAAGPGQQPGDLAPGTAEDEIEYRRDQAEQPEAAGGEAAEPELLEEEAGEALSEGAAEETGLGPARGAPTEVDPNFVPVPEDADVGERLYEPAVPGSMADEPGPIGMTPEEGAESPLEPPVQTQEGLVDELEVEVPVDPDAVVPVEPGEPGEDITEEVVPADRGPPE